jgi:RecB family endonuclease NucS
MLIQNPIWKAGATPETLTVSKLATEKDLEDMITARPEMISSGWLLVGRQVRTSFGGIIDLLAITPDGSLALDIEGLANILDRRCRVLRSSTEVES